MFGQAWTGIIIIIILFLLNTIGSTSLPLSSFNRAKNALRKRDFVRTLSSNTIPRRGNRGRIMLQDLDPGTKYGMLWFVACSTVNANSCQQLDAQECSLPIKIPPLTTEMPVVYVFFFLHWISHTHISWIN